MSNPVRAGRSGAAVLDVDVTDAASSQDVELDDYTAEANPRVHPHLGLLVEMMHNMLYGAS